MYSEPALLELWLSNAIADVMVFTFLGKQSKRLLSFITEILAGKQMADNCAKLCKLDSKNPLCVIDDLGFTHTLILTNRSLDPTKKEVP